MTPRPKGVFFDLGGTLFSYRPVFRATRHLIDEAAQRLGVEAPRREIGRAYGEAATRANREIAGRPYYTHRELFRTTYRYFAEAFDRPASDDYLDWFEVTLRDATIAAMELREDCLETLRALGERGIYRSIVSNIDDDHLHPMVEQSGLDAVLEHWTSSEEARSCKPDARFFQVALEKAGLGPEEVLFVGDSPEHDVLGARGVGMRSVLLVEPGGRPPLQTGRAAPDPDLRIEALGDLLQHLA